MKLYSMYSIKNIINVIIIIAFFLGLYRTLYGGKFIIKIKREKKKISKSMIIYVIVVIIGVVLLGLEIKDSIFGDKINMDIFSGIVILLIVPIDKIINEKKSLGIKKRGIALGEDKLISFYRWSEVKGYNWISENEISFRIETGKLFPSTFCSELKVEDNQRSKINKLMIEHDIPKYDEKLINSENNNEKANKINIKQVCFLLCINAIAIAITIQTKEMLFVVISAAATFILISEVKNLYRIKEIEIIIIVIIIAIPMYTMYRINIFERNINIKKQQFDKNAAVLILKETYKPVIKYNARTHDDKILPQKKIYNSEEIKETFEKNMTERVAGDIYDGLTTMNEDKELVVEKGWYFPSIYDKGTYVKEAYIEVKTERDEDEKEVLIIQEKGEVLDTLYKRTSHFIKNKDGKWILSGYEGTEHFGRN